ncbi:MAG: glutathione S-transferase family protein [Acidobacteriota bacterium]
MLVLHHLDRSPFGWKVRMVIAEKNVPCTLVIPENKNESPEFQKLNPYRLTPVLVLEDGRTLYESTIINEYLEEAFPQPRMLPTDMYERARIRLIEDTIDQYVYPAGREYRTCLFDFSAPFLIPKAKSTVDQAALEAATAKLHRELARLEMELQGRRWFGGELFTLADAALTPLVTGALPLLGWLPDAARYPNLSAWSSRTIERPSWKVSAPKEPLRIKS